ncbi:TPA: hypothetical protein ACG0BA_002229 [Serratia odorifera]
MFSFFSEMKEHAALMQTIKQKCNFIGAPDDLAVLMIVMHEKTSFSLKKGSPALLQPFISGRISAEDKINIYEATGYVLDMQNVLTIDDYKKAISALLVKLR